MNDFLLFVGCCVAIYALQSYPGYWVGYEQQLELRKKLKSQREEVK